MNIDRMCAWASESIWRAEQLEDQGLDTSQHWRDVSDLEERLAQVTDVASPEGYLVRDGSVRAALKAGEPARAQALAERFSQEHGISEALREALWQLIREDEEAVTARFPSAAKRLRLSDVRDLAQRLREAGAFGLAA
jgi:hypothetical protein